MKGRIAAIQMTSSHNVAKNCKVVEHWANIAKEKGADVILLPENFALMGLHDTDKLQIAESFGEGPLQTFLSELAKKQDLWVIGGTLPLYSKSERKVTTNEGKVSKNEGKVTTSTLVFNPQGLCVTRYDKIHLFDVEVDSKEAHAESKTIFPGDKVIAFTTPFATIGLTICYDLRFPELYRQLFNTGVEVFVVPSAFTQKTGAVHWEILLRARAIENLSYVVAANQSGTHSNGRATFGHSMIIDPFGKILDCLPSGEGLVIADIDLNYMEDLRRRFPVREHQRIGK